MLEAAQTTTTMQRARGRAAVGFVMGPGGARLTDLHQSGCAKAMLPRCHGIPEAVFLNTAGGLTGGDRLEYAMSLGAGAQATATTQTAERAYASAGGVARVACRFDAGRDARLDWLPQETILFNGASLERETMIKLGVGASLLFCETLVLGRAAMGETVTNLNLRDRREVWRDGRPVLLDPVLIDDACLARREGPALLGGARAVALVALVADGAEDALGPAKALLEEDGVVAAASAWDGRCVVRLMADDAWPLRRVMVRLLTKLRGSPPPRVWQI